MDTIAASADLATATVLAMRGDHDGVQPLITSALAKIDATADRATAARARHAAGIAALADGSYATACAQLCKLFDADGTPLHHHVSYLAIADLAAAAVRVERHLEAQTLIERALAQADPAPGPRLEQLAARARALLSGTASAEAHFDKALADPAGDIWPFERAELQLDYGEWLRRQRRINDAKPVLAAALETLRSLGATPWIRRAEAASSLRRHHPGGGHHARRERGPDPAAAPDRHPGQPGLTNGESPTGCSCPPAPSPPTCTTPTPSSASPAPTSSATASTRPPTGQPLRRPADRPQTRANPRSAVTRRRATPRVWRPGRVTQRARRSLPGTAAGDQLRAKTAPSRRTETPHRPTTNKIICRLGSLFGSPLSP